MLSQFPRKQIFYYILEKNDFMLCTFSIRKICLTINIPFGIVRGLIVLCMLHVCWWWFLATAMGRCFRRRASSFRLGINFVHSLATAQMRGMRARTLTQKATPCGLDSIMYGSGYIGFVKCWNYWLQLETRVIKWQLRRTVTSYPRYIRPFIKSAGSIIIDPEPR